MTIRSGRLKWYGISFGQLKVSIEELASKLEEFSFMPEEEISKGFKLERVSEKTLHAKFISKMLVEQVINLPVGGEFVQVIAEVSTIDFDIELGRDGYIRVENPPRSMVQFFNSLALAFEFKCSIEPVEIDVSKALLLLKERLDGFVVNYIDVSCVWLGNGVQLRAALAGEVGVEDELKKLLAEKASTIEGVRFKFVSDGLVRNIEINRRAGMKIIRSLPDEDFRLIKSSLIESVII
ncbi:hypothetical protein ACTJJ2_19065 [Pseudomonas sp. 22447]|uniref:hypothetical protein n=1 Tax=Pseudomonas sp. 22447 TaxID=3453919 RepID=UPI003F84E47E